MIIDKNYFPAWVRKSISFTIDDGNLEMDKKFIDIVKPYGIKGTFNISDFNFEKLSPEGYRDFYSGYEISNHCKYHPMASSDGVEYVIKDGPRPEHSEIPNALYKIVTDERLYATECSNVWRRIALPDGYLSLVRECTADIEAVFGVCEKMGFVWPYGLQRNSELFEMLKNEGFYGIRKTGSTEDKYGFALPSDRMSWSYNANNSNLVSVSEKYAAYPDDGELKTFIFGVHSVDFERSGNWCDLERFVRDFGGRPELYWYASVGEIFAYEDAVKALSVTETAVENNSDITLYITADGEKIILKPHSVYTF